MLLQKIEFYETKDIQYLLIPKNGSMSVLKSFEKIPHIVTRELANKVKWTVVRNPIDRLISGLAYDLNLQKLSLKDINIKSLFYSNMHSVIKEFHYVSHTSLQIYYLFNAKINWYINIEDLDIFLKMHFNQTAHDNKSSINKKYDIEKYIDKDEIMKYLHLDYYVYNRIKQSPFLWEWQHGKIF